jgi:hypothetical protein
LLSKFHNLQFFTCARKPPIAGPITRAIAREDVTYDIINVRHKLVTSKINTKKELFKKLKKVTKGLLLQERFPELDALSCRLLKHKPRKCRCNHENLRHIIYKY